MVISVIKKRRITMESKNLFANGRIINGGNACNLDDIEWNPHPAFKGVFLKHIIKGTDTGQRLSSHIVED